MRKPLVGAPWRGFIVWDPMERTPVGSLPRGPRRGHFRWDPYRIPGGQPRLGRHIGVPQKWPHGVDLSEGTHKSRPRGKILRRGTPAGDPWRLLLEEGPWRRHNGWNFLEDFPGGGPRDWVS
jgi:hypothetical protein